MHKREGKGGAVTVARALAAIDESTDKKERYISIFSKVHSDVLREYPDCVYDSCKDLWDQAISRAPTMLPRASRQEYARNALEVAKQFERLEYQIRRYERSGSLQVGPTARTIAEIQYHMDEMDHIKRNSN